MPTLSTAKHTPGPWAESDWMESFVSITHDGLVVAEVQPKLWNGTPKISRAEVKANARLIAAAPDLLEALKSVTADADEAIKEAGGCDHSVGICMCPEKRNVERAREAIARAEGN